MKRLTLTLVCAALLVSGLGGCASPRVATQDTDQTPYPEHWLNAAGPGYGESWQHLGPEQAYLPVMARKARGSEQAESPFIHPARQREPGLSPGDRIRLWLPGSRWNQGFFDDDDGTFSGLYEIGMNGYLNLPYLAPIQTYGLHVHELEAVINANLERQDIYQKGMARVSITVQEWAPVTVFVNGAVFNNGQVTINGRSKDVPAEQFNTKGETLALDRKLSAALRAAGGVRPDADISQVKIRRADGETTIDLRGMTDGYPVQDITLMHGDYVFVPSLGVPQEQLIAPSPITPPGLRVYISNLTTPAFDNASSAVGQHSTSLPYGSRLHTAIVSGNCAGGIASTNSARRVVLVTRDPVRQQPVTIERKVEVVMRDAHNSGTNPYLMPDDSVVCYDSEITNLRDIARTIGEILIPLPIFR